MYFDVIRGDVERQTAHALVNTTGPNCRMECGVAGSFRSATDGAIVETISNERPLDAGAVVVTDAYGLPALYLFHAVSKPSDGPATDRSIRTAVRSVLEKADERGCRSIALPLVGCGGGGCAVEDGATAICETILAFEPDSLADVRIVAHSNDDLERVRTVASDLAPARNPRA